MFSKNRILLLSLRLLFLIALLDGCSCNCGKSGDENIVKGYITVVGNEPFTKLALQTDDNKTYILQCDGDVKDDLWKKQGNYFYIKFSRLIEKENTSTIVVEKAVQFTKSEK